LSVVGEIEKLAVGARGTKAMMGHSIDVSKLYQHESHAIQTKDCEGQPRLEQYKVMRVS